jgi:hypothetical protein
VMPNCQGSWQQKDVLLPTASYPSLMIVNRKVQLKNYSSFYPSLTTVEQIAWSHKFLSNTIDFAE